MEDRIIRLEETVAIQERIIEQLSDALTEQQVEIAEMSKQLRLLGERVKNVGPGSDNEPGDEPPPPHYL